LQIGVDIGGTFTDIVALDAEGRLVLTKVPSTPKDLLEGIDTAVRRVLTLAGAPASAVERFIHGTTVATNAVLEQKGAMTAILTTEGFEDVLELRPPARSEGGVGAARVGERRAYFAPDGFVATSIYDRVRLPLGSRVPGPAIVEQADTTTVIPPGYAAAVDPSGNLRIRRTP
jgi:N-methylhydantoinase A/oxoprolinase/acetone carboxylase beta subunit